MCGSPAPIQGIIRFKLGLKLKNQAWFELHSELVDALLNWGVIAVGKRNGWQFQATRIKTG